MVNNYFERIDRTILQFTDIVDNHTINKNKFNETQALLLGVIIFIDKSKLSFMEFIDLDVNGKIKYKYHYMNENNEQIFRFDNAKHHPDIKTYSHHVHIGNKISESKEPQLFDVSIKIHDKLAINQ
ncbi:MAG: hypothetical protein DRI95_08225 [Bacteroidetes bacterium]|nr:MAG: hypothetical protein DRI95_08225 [Bacteroidota bacterium]